eukprot:g7804.t1
MPVPEDSNPYAGHLYGRRDAKVPATLPDSAFPDRTQTPAPQSGCYPFGWNAFSGNILNRDFVEAARYERQRQDAWARNRQRAGLEHTMNQTASWQFKRYLEVPT